MEIIKSINGEEAVLALSGRLDTVSAPEFEAELKNVIDIPARRLIIDLESLVYTSSAGLRVFLKAQKAFGPLDGMKLINVNSDIMEVLEITGFLDIMEVEAAGV